MNIGCPFAEVWHEKGTDTTPSFGVQVNPAGQSRYNCFSCQASGREITEMIFQMKGEGIDADFKALNEFAMSELDNAEFPDIEDFEETTGLFPFAEDWLESFIPATHNGQALAYLKGRNVPQKLIKYMDLRWDGFHQRVCFPIRGEDQVLYGFHGRGISKNAEPRYWAYGYKNRRNPQVWLGEHTVDFTKPVVVAESVFDYANILKIYRNVISPLHADISPYALDRIESAFEIVTVLDPDKAGSMGRTKIKKWAGPKRIVEHVILPDGKDAGEMDIEPLMEKLEPFVTFDEIWD